MSVQQVTISTRPLKYKRLLVADITRLPKGKIGTSDSFICSEQMKKNEKRALLQKIFTLATFGIVGLYIAHRKNLFNPIKREVRKLIHDNAFQKRIKDFTYENASSELYPTAARKFLHELINVEERDEVLKVEAQKILDEPQRFQALIKKINDNAQKENLTPEQFKDGFFFDLMEKLKIKLEEDLIKNKKNNIPYKNQGQALTDNLFKVNGNAPQPIQELLLDATKSRIADDIEKFLNDAVLDAKIKS